MRLQLVFKNFYPKAAAILILQKKILSIREYFV